MTPEEYLRSEREAQQKHEYMDGFVYPLHAQAGASRKHVRLTLRIGAMLEPLATRRGCRAYAADMKLRADGWRNFFYPDVMVSCGPDESEQDYETDACLIVEVLSGSTAAQSSETADRSLVSPSSDRTGKFAAYTKLPSLQTYLLVEQAQRRIYAYAKAGAEWELTEYESGLIPLPCLGAVLDVNKVYAGLVE